MQSRTIDGVDPLPSQLMPVSRTMVNRQTRTVWLLGLTQIVGYGTLYYSFAILAADIAASLGVTHAGFFGVFSLSLLAGALAAPHAGRALDRFGPASVMTYGSAACAVAVAIAAFSPNIIVFTVALIVMQMASALVLYDAAFAAIVAVSPGDGARRIVHLTLLAGFASSIFWPLTSVLDEAFGWRAVLGLYAAANLVLCMPLHGLAARWARESDHPAPLPQSDARPVQAHASLPVDQLRRAMVLVTLGFALSSFALSAVLSQMVPMLTALGFGASALAVSTLFGPAQVAVRFSNLMFGAKRHPLTIAIIALLLLPIALLTVAASAPYYAGGVLFVVLIGLASGLKSIVQGTVPLTLFGASGFGARLGFMASFRYALGALAPFVFAYVSEIATAGTAAVAFAIIGLLGVVALAEVARMVQRASKARTTTG